MRILVVVVLACALYGGYQWWQGRSTTTAAVASPNGFVPVEMPDGVARNAVLVLAPRNCPSEQAQRTENMGQSRLFSKNRNGSRRQGGSNWMSDEV